jgi:L-fuculose-phosphate aldolase
MDAYFKTEIIDAYCRILILTKPLGGPKYYNDAKAAELIRLKPGIGVRDVRLELGLENCDLCGNSLFREGYSESFKPEPHAFIPDKFQQAPQQAACAMPNQPAKAEGAEFEAMVQAITEQVMRVMGGGSGASGNGQSGSYAGSC